MSYEVGSKDKLFDRSLQVSTSVYYIQWKNIQQAVYVPTCGIQYTANLGNAISQGFDVQAQWRVTHALQLELSVGYTDAKYSSTAMSTGATPGPLSIKGDALDVTPWTVSFGAQYNFTIFDHDAFIRGDDEFNSKRTTPTAAEDSNTVYYDPGLVPNPATNQLSLRGGVSIAKWDLAVFADNVLDAHPQLNLTHQDRYTLLFEAQTFRPRTIGVSSSYRF